MQAQSLKDQSDWNDGICRGQERGFLCGLRARKAPAPYRREGRKPVLLERIAPGYVANRLQASMTLEITRMLDEGWASPEAIDDSIKYGLALRRTTTGALMKGGGGDAARAEGVGVCTHNWPLFPFCCLIAPYSCGRRDTAGTRSL
mgnify:CR=1 FL=1|tara:strand:- start:1800 stop:2237 length:438 start_codon:yes stop_codon:yes gene_type:complete